jgi:hypothetical protein
MVSSLNREIEKWGRGSFKEDTPPKTREFFGKVIASMTKPVSTR